MTVLTVFFIVVVAYFIIGYKQLFGYSLWGTLWRLVFVFAFVYCFALLLAYLVFYSGPSTEIQVAGNSLPAKSFMTSFYISVGTLIMATGYFINRLTTRNAQRPQQP